MNDVKTAKKIESQVRVAYSELQEHISKATQSFDDAIMLGNEKHLRTSNIMYGMALDDIKSLERKITKLIELIEND